MNNTVKSTNKESALRQQSLFQTPQDIVTDLESIARAMGVEIKITPTNEIRICRWHYFRSFQDSAAALKFLQEMGVVV